MQGRGESNEPALWHKADVAERVGVTTGAADGGPVGNAFSVLGCCVTKAVGRPLSGSWHSTTGRE